MNICPEHVARLARIALTEEEKQSLSQDLPGVLTWVAQLQEVVMPDGGLVDGSAPIPDTQKDMLAPLFTPLRSDEAGTWRAENGGDLEVSGVWGAGSVQDVLANAPAGRVPYFTVPKVLE